MNSIAHRGSSLPAGLLGSNFYEAQANFTKAINAGDCNTQTFIEFMKIAGDCGQFEEVQKAFALSRKLEKINIVIANVFLVCASKNRRFDLVKKTYDEIMGKGLATAFTFARYIKAAGIQGNWKEVIRAYKEAKQLYQDKEIRLTSKIMSDFIHATGRYGTLKQLHAAFSEAKQLGLADKLVIEVYNFARSKFHKA